MAWHCVGRRNASGKVGDHPPVFNSTLAFCSIEVRDYSRNVAFALLVPVKESKDEVKVGRNAALTAAGAPQVERISWDRSSRRRHGPSGGWRNWSWLGKERPLPRLTIIWNKPQDVAPGRRWNVNGHKDSILTFNKVASCGSATWPANISTRIVYWDRLR